MSDGTKDDGATITKSTKVSLAIAVALVLGTATQTTKVAAWVVERESVEREMADEILALTHRVGELDARIVGRSADGWHRAQMTWWVADLARNNPELVAPDVAEVPQ